MNIDYTTTKQAWLDIINQFIAIISTFFKELGIKLFNNSDAVDAGFEEITANPVEWDYD